RITGIEFAQRGEHIAREAPWSVAVHSMKDIARQRLLKLLLGVGCLKCGEIGALSAVKCFAKVPHPLWHSEIAHSYFTQIGAEVTPKQTEQFSGRAPGRNFRGRPNAPAPEPEGER